MKYKFERYKVHHKKKDYYVLIPKIHNQLWVVDWADDWYEGCFLDGSAECLMNLIASYSLLSFNPYTIIYFPIRDKPIPNGLCYGDNGKYDMVFTTNRVQLKLSDWKEIRQKLKYTKWTTYKFDFNIERMKKYFSEDIDKNKIYYDNKRLWRSGANMQIASSTTFFVFPKSYYAENAIELYEYFSKELEENDFNNCYDEDNDRWTCYTMSSFVYGGVPRRKLRYERPYVTFYLELYDLEIINRYKKKKDYFVKNRNQAVQPQKGGYNTIKIKIG